MTFSAHDTFMRGKNNTTSASRYGAEIIRRKNLKRESFFNSAEAVCAGVFSVIDDLQ